MGAGNPNDERQHILTVNLEDYFQVAAVSGAVSIRHWARFESRLEENTRRTLDLLDASGASATVFILGWIAERFPELVRTIRDRGHEPATRGHMPHALRDLSPEAFRDDLLRSREALERAAGVRIRGFRAARGGLGPADLWALTVLREEGFDYDSSVRPLGRWPRDGMLAPVLHQCSVGDGTVWEVPLSTLAVGGWRIPVSGGNFLRQLPHALVSRALEDWDRKETHPFVFYFHAWELDSEQPRVGGVPWLQRVRQYRNLDSMAERIGHYLERYRFTGIARHLGLPTEAVAPAPRTVPVPVADAPAPIALRRPRRPLSVVVPCYNEEAILGYVANTLRDFAAAMADRYAVTFIFVDDGSTDGTWDLLNRLFGEGGDCGGATCVLLRHPANRGLAAATLTGVQAARSEVVCVMDCDCTYDPFQFREMLEQLTDDVAVVTASPYHPQGRVMNVPGWRLFLSRGASWLYRRILVNRLHTYTSLFRVYRKSALEGIRPRDERFIGIAEILVLLDLRGERIVEHPAVLESRLLGCSKMRVLATVLGHLRLMLRAALARRRASLQPAPAVPRH